MFKTACHSNHFNKLRHQYTLASQKGRGNNTRDAVSPEKASII